MTNVHVVQCLTHYVLLATLDLTIFRVATSIYVQGLRGKVGGNYDAQFQLQFQFKFKM